MANSKVFSLKKSSEFQFIAKQGYRLRVNNWLTLQLYKVEEQSIFFGCTISRKVANAVVRNKLKRWIRFLIKNQNSIEQFTGHKVVFVFKPVKSESFYRKLIYKDFLIELQNIKLK